MDNYYAKEQVICAFSETTFNNVTNIIAPTMIEQLVGIKKYDLIKYERFTYKGSVYTYEQAKFLFNNHFMDDLSSFSAMNEEKVFRYIARTAWCEGNTRSSQYDKLYNMYASHSNGSKPQENIIKLLNATANSAQTDFADVLRWIEVNGWENEVKAIVKGEVY